MNRGIEAAARGMINYQLMLDVVANNLANANTTGFKRDGLAFNEVLETAAYVLSKPAGVIGTGAQLVDQYVVGDPGTLVETGNPMHAALTEPDQFFTVQTEAGIRYTRDGAFTVNTDGNLSLASGDPVLDATGQPIFVGRPADAGEIRIDTAGKVLVGEVETGLLDVREGQLLKVGHGLWTGDAQPVTSVRLETGAIEGSNVEPIREMVRMTEIVRRFEAAQKAVQLEDEMTGHLLRSLA